MLKAKILPKSILMSVVVLVIIIAASTSTGVAHASQQPLPEPPGNGPALNIEDILDIKTQEVGCVFDSRVDDPHESGNEVSSHGGGPSGAVTTAPAVPG